MIYLIIFVSVISLFFILISKKVYKEHDELYINQLKENLRLKREIEEKNEIIAGYNLELKNKYENVLKCSFNEISNFTMNPPFLNEILVDELIKNKKVSIEVYEREPDFKRLNRTLGNLEKIGITYRVQQPAFKNEATFELIVFLKEV